MSECVRAGGGFCSRIHKPMVVPTSVHIMTDEYLGLVYPTVNMLM